MRVGLLETLAVVADDGSRLNVTGAKQRALMVMLAVEAGDIVSVDRLVDGAD